MPSPAEALLSLLLLTSPPQLATVSYASVPMPPTVVIFVCRTEIAGPPDQNARFTGSENLKWDTSDAMMHCRRIQIELIPADPSSPQPFNQFQCDKSIFTEGVAWNQAHRSSRYRFWKGACPTRIINTQTGRTIGWQLPACPVSGVIDCQQDSAI